MKLLYFGHFLEGTGWSHAAINNIIALDKAGIDVVCRNLKLSDSQPSEVVPLLHQNLSKPVSGIDCCIQHVLPHFLVNNNLFKKNIAFFEAETTTIKHLSWFDQLNSFEQVWVPCNHNKNTLINDGMDSSKIKIVPHTFDSEKYNTEERINMSVGTHGFFKFYTIVDLNSRKNLESIVRCFHTEFCNGEPVELVIKVSNGHLPESTAKHMLNSKIEEVKQLLRLYKTTSEYKQEIIISGYLSDEDMNMLHKSCHCFVLPSHGEGFSIPAFEAMAYGNTPICSKDGGPLDFIDPNNKNTGYLVDGVFGICQNPTPAFPEINTGREEWFNPSEREIKKAMRYYFEKRKEGKKKDGLKEMKKFSYENIGKKMQEILNA
tara:strand:+ start:1828 stop:2952 length:1125 start_codon:yes stop_codon:yes gene_type:complete